MENLERTLSETRDQILKSVKSLADEQKTELKAHADTIEELRLGLDKLRAHNVIGRFSPAETPGSRLIKSAGQLGQTPLEALRQSPRLRLNVDGSLLGGRLEHKTTITSGTVGSSTPGILVPERYGEIVPAARRRLTLRDVFESVPIRASAAEFVKENVFTNAASPQVEASAKGESALTFTIASETVRTLAHWIPATRQVLDDWTELGRFIDSTLVYGLRLIEETQILTGDGTGQNLNGLLTQAAAYAGTYVAAGDTNLDTLRHAILELEAANESPDLIVLNPVNWHNIELIKDAASNVGKYVVGDPSGLVGVTTLWGRMLVVTNSMTSGSFLVGNSMMAKIFDRQMATVEISTEHDDYFTKNLVAIRAEERLALGVLRPGAFIYGSF